MSLRTRALLAVVLTVCFYGLAISIGVGLIAFPIWWLASGNTGNIWIALALVGAGLAILRAIVPPRDSFDPPGPQLRPVDHPELAVLLDDVAKKSGVTAADSVYLDLDLNAAVLEHRGDRIMLLGLPLLATLSPDELRAVVAHEYGHYKGGDTRFVGWIWRTRHAVLNSVEQLANSESWFRRDIVRWPFHFYAVIFMRVTNAVSRRQEFAADLLSAEVASPAAAGSALRRLNALGPLYETFWYSDVGPMLDARKRPPIAAGFADMASHTSMSTKLDELVRTDIREREPDPYASHPTLRQRLEALGASVAEAAPPPAEVPAISLLRNVPQLERELLAQRLGPEVAGYAESSWEDAPSVQLERLRSTANTYGSVFGAINVAEAGDVARGLARYRDGFRRLLPEEHRTAMPDHVVQRGLLDTLASLVVVTGTRAGIELSGKPGEPMELRRDGVTLNPWDLLGLISRGEQAPHVWTAHPIVATIAAEPLSATQMQFN